LPSPRAPAQPPGTAADELDLIVRKADPDRWLASRFIGDAGRRAGVIALYAFDHELGRVRRVASNALLAEIRLTWWREALDEIFGGGPVRAHPVARALADVVAGHDLPRGPLEAMIDARIAALDKERLDLGEALRWADGVGGSATILAARVLDPITPPEAVAPAGRAWGLLLLRRAGVMAGAAFDELIASAVADAAPASRWLGAPAFPAVACASLIRAELRSGPRPAVETRLRLFCAVLRGRL
jgi:phytoene synthase